MQILQNTEDPWSCKPSTDFHVKVDVKCLDYNATVAVGFLIPQYFHTGFSGCVCVYILCGHRAISLPCCYNRKVKSRRETLQG